MSRSRLLSALLMLVLLVTALGTGGRAQAQTASVTFHETGKTVSGKFLDFWNTNGGLMQLGFPISDVMQDVSATDGKTYTVQYFERAILEMHPENAGTPSEVEGALLGVHAYNDRYFGPAPGQQASTDNATMFSQTGMTVGGKFRAYWEANGGLARFGYPISNEFQEQSDLDGKTRTVQYFERAIMELHPEYAGSPFEVELAQLGTYAYWAKTDLSYTDFTGTEVTLPARPQRIVCLVSLCEDILHELGIDPVAVSDKFYQLPQFWGPNQTFPAIGGGFGAPNVEDIAAAKPDLIIGFLPHIGLRDQLKPIAPLFIMNPAKYQDSLNYLLTMARLTDRTYQAEQSIAGFLSTLATYKAKSPNNKVPLILFGGSTNFSIFTQGSLFGSVLSAATNYPWPASPGPGAPDQEPGSLQYSLEKILAVDPDVLLVETVGAGTGGNLSKQLAANPIWSELKAVKNNQVYEVNPNYYVFGRGTRSLSYALADAMHDIYPDTFPAP